MTYTRINETSFSLSTEGTFCIPQAITGWQTRKFTEILSGVLRNCKGIGATLVTAGLAYATGDDKQSKEAFNTIFSQLGTPNFAGELTEGLADVLGYLAENNTLNKVAATLFLKDGESKVIDFDKRVELFDSVPFEQLKDGVSHFLSNRTPSSTNTPSPSPTTEPTNKRKRVAK